ncbi:hypothetical protein LJC62_01510 [Odoribacter sp. OttesenSCG-928-A06]|nr:hypothetical protein [Odoribacter sp. OttesenSCG-928-A06]
MGIWRTAIKSNDAFMDIYGEFFDLYNKGGKPNEISQKIIEENWEILEIDEEKHNLWFALALAQWETKSLAPEILSKVEEIIASKSDLKVWSELDASEQDIKKRAVVLEKFLEKIKSERAKPKPRKRIKTAIFSTGDCLIFRMGSGNYGGAIILATDNNPKTAYNLVATTRLNQKEKPTISDFEKSEILILNYASWNNKADIVWCAPDLYNKNFAEIYEVTGRISVEISYESNNYMGKGYLFNPSFTAGWNMKINAEKQFESELTKEKPTNKIMVAQVCKKKKWWKMR